MIGFYPDLRHENSWDGYNYNIQDSMGSRGTITFKDGEIVGAFRNDDEPVLVEIEKYLSQVPIDLKNILMEETFQYLLEKNELGDISPSVTTFFIVKDNYAVTIDTNEAFHRKSGDLISVMCNDFNYIVDYLEENYEMNETQLILLKKIYKRKIENCESTIFLTKEEIDMIGDLDNELLEICKEAFSEIDIHFEKTNT